MYSAQVVTDDAVEQLEHPGAVVSIIHTPNQSLIIACGESVTNQINYFPGSTVGPTRLASCARIHLGPGFPLCVDDTVNTRTHAGHAVLFTL